MSGYCGENQEIGQLEPGAEVPTSGFSRPVSRYVDISFNFMSLHIYRGYFKELKEPNMSQNLLSGDINLFNN